MHETILVVDDEQKIVKQAQDYLERGGFRVPLPSMELRTWPWRGVSGLT